MKFFVILIICDKLKDMMRVISGKFKGKKIKEPTDFLGSRPTMDRIKESMFDILQHKVRDAKVLDLFAGSGALGIEALSRGAKSCCFVDNTVDAVNLIKNNLKTVGAEAEVLNCDYLVAIDKYAGLGVKFDIIILDPPYSTALGLDSLLQIKNKKILCKDGIVVFETNRDLIAECEAIFGEADVRKYGKKYLIFLENK